MATPLIVERWKLMRTMGSLAWCLPPGELVSDTEFTAVLRNDSDAAPFDGFGVSMSIEADSVLQDASGARRFQGSTVFVTLYLLIWIVMQAAWLFLLCWTAFMVGRSL